MPNELKWVVVHYRQLLLWYGDLGILYGTWIQRLNALNATQCHERYQLRLPKVFLSDMPLLEFHHRTPFCIPLSITKMWLASRSKHWELWIPDFRQCSMLLSESLLFSIKNST